MSVPGTPGTRSYDIWMPVAMIALVIIAIISVASFAAENILPDPVPQCTVLQGGGRPPVIKPCGTVTVDDNNWREPPWFPPASPAN